MNRDLSDYRKVYSKNSLDENNLIKNPIKLFEEWFSDADKFEGIEEANAMTLATLGEDGFLKNRIVLLKEFTKEGFVWYTNYNSEKGKSIELNKKAALSFYWQGVERQVIIKGNVERVSKEKSDAYFNVRPKGSQLGAIVSNQSEVIPNRQYLEDKLLELEKQFDGKVVSRPEHWGGYILKPIEIEFWQGRPNRLHDRIRFTKINSNNWKIERLSP